VGTVELSTVNIAITLLLGTGLDLPHLEGASILVFL